MLELRLRKERERLKLTQEAFAEAAGAKRRTLIDWEKGISSPTAVQLSALSEIGVDVQYVLTGRNAGGGIGEAVIHQAVLDAVDLLSLEKKVDANQLAKAVVKLCAKAGPSPEGGSSSAHVGTNHGHVVGGDQVNHGPVVGGNIEGSLQVFHQAPKGSVAGGDIVKKTRK